MIVNSEGWFITAGHILKEIAALDEQVRNPEASDCDKVTHYVSIFGATNSPLCDILVEEELDLGVGRLENYSAPEDYMFPKLRVREVEQGELLCRMGYPFVDSIGPTWEQDKGFVFTNLFPVPMFVNEALVSRFARLKSGVWIETSSPGLKGQSGGPLVDTDGFICGIQVNTCHYPLGFEGTGRDQVLNVGRAVHIETIRRFLTDHDVTHATENDQND